MTGKNVCPTMTDECLSHHDRQNVCPPEGRDWLTVAMDFALGWFFRLFNWGFERSTAVYTRGVGLLLRGSALTLVVYGGLLGLTWWGFAHVPTGFIPEQDKGYLLVNVQLPEAAAVERTREVIDRMDRLAHSIPGVAHTVGIAGESILLSANAPNFGSMFVILDPFDKRREPDRYDKAIGQRLQRLCYREIPEAVVSVFGAPPVDGLGTAGGLQADGRRPRQPRLQGLAGGHRRADRPGQPRSALRRPVHPLPLEHAATLRRHRPRQGQVDGRQRGRRLQHAPGLYGLDVRQQLQRVRSLVAGEAPGRRPFSARCGAGGATEGPQLGRRRWFR